MFPKSFPTLPGAARGRVIISKIHQFERIPGIELSQRHLFSIVYPNQRGTGEIVSLQKLLFCRSQAPPVTRERPGYGGFPSFFMIQPKRRKVARAVVLKATSHYATPPIDWWLEPTCGITVSFQIRKVCIVLSNCGNVFNNLEVSEDLMSNVNRLISINFWVHGK